jgi:hypothetical protein
MELEESDKFLMEFFELFKVIERIVENDNICIKELNRPKDHENNKKIYSKSISTLRRKLNKMVDYKYLLKESARRHDKDNAHFVYGKTDNLQEILILMHNRLSILINRKIDKAVIEKLDVRLLEDLISRVRLNEMLNTTKALGSNLS